MNQEQWTAVDHYLADTLVKSDAVLEAGLAASDKAGLPSIHVAPGEGKLLHMLARMIGAKRVLEIGTLAGYSTIWMARALPPGGRVVTIEYELKHADVARTNLANANLGDVVDVRVGRALEVLPQIDAEKLGPFDLVFIDADKAGNPDYFTWALKLSRPGSLIIVDNVVRDGEVVNATSTDASIIGTRRVLEMMGNEPRVIATALQTVGRKGYDGFAIAMVKGT